jgi:hypothetical protein
LRSEEQVVDQQHLDLVDVAIPQLLQLLRRHILIALDDDFAGRGVDDVVRDDASDDLLGRDGDLFDARGLHLLDRGARELPPFLNDQLVGRGMANVARRLDARELIRVEELRHLAIVEDDHVFGVEVVQQILRAHAERAQQDRRVELAAAVDAHEQDVAGVELEIDPRAAIRDDARGIEQLPRGVRLALVMVEEHARGAVELRHDDPLGAVHHEGAVHGHQRDLPEVDLLLFHVLDRAHVGLRIDIPDDELNRHLERRRVRHPSLVAFLDVVFRGAEGVADEFERGGFVEVLDREDRFENALQPDLLATLGRRTGLQKFVVRALLDIDQIGDVDDPFDAPEMPAQPKVVGDLSCHQCSSFRVTADATRMRSSLETDGYGRGNRPSAARDSRSPPGPSRCMRRGAIPAPFAWRDD